MSRRERVVEVMRAGQAALIEGFETADGEGRFIEHRWDRPGGGGAFKAMIASSIRDSTKSVSFLMASMTFRSPPQQKSTP